MNNVTTCLRLSHLLAKLQDAGIDFSLSEQFFGAQGESLRAIVLIKGSNEVCDGVVMERADGTYRLFIEQPSPFIADDVKWVESALEQSGPLLMLIEN